MEYQIVDVLIAVLFGLLIGSFLNVVIHRLPIMMERGWRIEARGILGLPEEDEPIYNIATPSSACPKCGHKIRWFENIPVLSYLFLKGKCRACSVRISFRYPAIEIITGSLFGYFAYTYGLTIQATVWATFGAFLLALAMIDWDTTLLPDSITLPLVWLGLISASQGYTQLSLESSLWGAVAGYMSLWSVYWLFKIVTKKEGMGYGDFKLLAVLGAWFGAGAILPIIIASSFIGAFVGLYLKFTNGLREGKVMPFGPFLAGAGFASVFGLTDYIMKIFN